MVDDWAVGVDQWLITYRGYSTSDLSAELTWLREQARNPFASQNEGNRGYARSPSDIKERLAAASQVMAERNGTDCRIAQANFSNVRV